MKKIIFYVFSVCIFTVFSCSAPEKSKTDSEGSTGSDSNDNSTSLALTWNQGSWDSHNWQ